MSNSSYTEKVNSLKKDSLDFHENGTPGKIGIHATKPLNSQRDLSLAYSPGVAFPCLAIQEDENNIYKYTSKGNFVAVISNGTAVLGLGNLGAPASKPVMEGKSVLFKRFADIDSIDVEVNTENADEFINSVKFLGKSWGGINLEDIKAPECFIIERELKKLLDIPVFHDDQHGTAIVSLAGVLNAMQITGRKIENLKVVVNGAGAAGIACLELLKSVGLKDENAILCDTTGVIYRGREKGMNEWKLKHACDTTKRALSEAMEGADLFLGLSVKGAVTPEMVKSMAKNPIIFAMANPEPEILPEEVHKIRDDAIVATGRSDYENQVNNVMGFPYIFRGALDVNAKEINTEMKIAAAEALAELAREHVPAEVSIAYGGKEMKFGPKYIIPTPFDHRLITTIPMAVARAAIESGVARKKIADWDEYRKELAARRDPTANSMSLIYQKLRKNPKKVVFAEGEEENVIMAATIWRDRGYGSSVLVGRQDRIEAAMSKMNITDKSNIEIINAAISKDNDKYIDYVYGRLQRKGYLRRDCVRLVKNDRIFFSSAVLACHGGDLLITGLTRGYRRTLMDLWQIFEKKEDDMIFGMNMLIAKGRTVFISDTACTELASSEQLATIAIKTAERVRKLGYQPRVAFLSYSNFGSAINKESERIRNAVKILDEKGVDFEYDGEMTADVALDEERLAEYPFVRLKSVANILIVPGLHSASISTKLLSTIGHCNVIGPILSGFKDSVQITSMKSTTSEILNLAAIAAAEANGK